MSKDMKQTLADYAGFLGVVAVIFAAMVLLGCTSAEACTDCATTCETMIVPIYQVNGQPLPAPGRWYTYNTGPCEGSDPVCLLRPRWAATGDKGVVANAYHRPFDIFNGTPDPDGCGNYFQVVGDDPDEKVKVEVWLNGGAGYDFVCAQEAQ